MSAYIVEKNHIQFIMAVIQNPIICRHGFSYIEAGEWVKVAPGDFEAVAKVGNILWQANAKSVNARYNDKQTVAELTARDVSMNYGISPIQALRSLDCLAYQSNEAADWKQSTAFQIIERLIKAAYQSLPGYSTAIYGAPERGTSAQVFAAN